MSLAFSPRETHFLGQTGCHSGFGASSDDSRIDITFLEVQSLAKR